MDQQTITLLLRLTHVLGGIIWVGGALFMAAFVLPAVRATGPEGGRFMQHLVGRGRLPIYLGVAMLLTVLSGFTMYARLAAATTGSWAGTRPGMAYGFGGLAAILGAVVGMVMGGGSARRLGAIGKQIAETGGPPTPEQRAEIERLQGRTLAGSRVTAVLLLLSASAMAVARYL